MFLLFIYPNFCSLLFYYFFFVLSSILQTFFCFLLNSIFFISEKDHLIFGGLLGGFYFFLGSLTTHMVLWLWISSLAFLRVFRMFSGISALGLNSKITSEYLYPSYLSSTTSSERSLRKNSALSGGSNMFSTYRTVP